MSNICEIKPSRKDILVSVPGGGDFHLVQISREDNSLSLLDDEQLRELISCVDRTYWARTNQAAVEALNLTIEERGLSIPRLPICA